MTEFKKDISVLKLINYNLVFFIPLIVLYITSLFLSSFIAPHLEISQGACTQLFMVILSLITFFILIPFLRIRESIKGVRFSLFNFVVVGFVITIPSLINGNYGVLMSALIYLANFLFATFINCPDVIGISSDPEDWFKHKVQLVILIIWVSIVLLYTSGFAWIYYQLAHNAIYINPFAYVRPESTSFATYFYYSFETMAMVGYGDIMPISAGARLTMCLQTLIAVMTNVIFLSTLMMYISYAQGNVTEKAEKKIEKEQKVLEEEEKRIEREEKKIESEEMYIDRNHSSDFAQYRSKYPNYMNGSDNRR